MADPKVQVTVVADGKRKNGVLTPSAGATIELMISDAVSATFGIDYSDPDVTIVRLGGDVEKRLGTKGNIRASGTLEKSLKEGGLYFDGALTMKFSRDVSVKVDTQLERSKKHVGLKVTMAFG